MKAAFRLCIRSLALIGPLVVAQPSLGADVNPKGEFRSASQLEAAAWAGDPDAILNASWAGGYRRDGRWPGLVGIAAAGHPTAAAAVANAMRAYDGDKPSPETVDAIRHAALIIGEEKLAAVWTIHELTGQWEPVGERDYAPTLISLAERGNPEAVSLACRLAARPGFITARLIGFCRDGAKMRLPEASYALARMRHARPDDFLGGLEKSILRVSGLRPSLPAAILHYRQAAEAGHAGAQARLAHLTAIGASVPKDEAQARHLAKLSADQGDVEGKAVLGLLLLRGKGGAAEPERALTLLEQAARGGNRMAQFTLATVHMRGSLALRDFTAALTWLHLSDLSKRGDPPETEADPLLLEPLRRTRLVARSLRPPMLDLDALSRAVALRKEVAANGEWPLVPVVPAKVAKVAKVAK